jgi:tetratricopeptide (TPR) repeat protein
MSSSSVVSQVGSAWGHLRQQNYRDAINEFETILKSAPEDIDAIYGLGLALKADGQNEAAIKSFQKAYSLAKIATTQVPEHHDIPDQGQLEDKLEIAGQNTRYMMLTRMLKQRLTELKAPPKDE